MRKEESWPLKEENWSKARSYLIPLALLGNSDAQYAIGWIYAFGKGVSKDDNEAIKWFRKANAWTCFKDNNCSGITDNASPAEYDVAQRYAELHRLKDNPAFALEALKWYQRSAEGGYKKAAQTLSEAYQEGLLNLEKDREKAHQWDVIARRQHHEGGPLTRLATLMKAHQKRLKIPIWLTVGLCVIGGYLLYEFHSKQTVFFVSGPIADVHLKAGGKPMVFSCRVEDANGRSRE